MPQSRNVEYTVVLVSSHFGAERDHAEQIIEEALAYLNTYQDEPGFRFAPSVTARLEWVPDVEQAQAKLEADEAVAMMILHDLADDERRAFTRTCRRQGVPVCYTLPGPDESESRTDSPRARRRDWKVVFRKRSDDEEPVAHRISDTVLTAPLEDDPEELRDRVGQLIAVLALGVMEHHWTTHPPQRYFPNSDS